MSDIEPVPQSISTQERPPILSSLPNNNQVEISQPTTATEIADQKACEALIEQIKNKGNTSGVESEVAQDIPENAIMMEQIKNDMTSIEDKSIFGKLKKTFISLLNFFKKLIWS